jgi:hypothetical protein
MKHALTRTIITGIIAAAILASRAAEGRLDLNLNPAWRFQAGDQNGEPWSANYDDSAWDIISLPHSLELFSANLDGFPEHGRTTGWYRRQLQVPSAWLAKRVFIEFRGAMQATTLWVNGKAAGTYAVSGYDTFSFDITKFLHEGTNVLAVQVDNRVNRDIPPDGQNMDYILLGGLYRDVFLHVTDPVHLTFPWEAAQAGIRLTCSPSASAAGRSPSPQGQSGSDGEGRGEGELRRVRDGDPHGEAAVVEAGSTVRNDSDQIQKCILRTAPR